MNPVNQAQMREFSKTFSLSDLKDSDQFELYSIYSVLNGGSGECIEPFDAHLKGTEFGLDGVAIIIQGNLVTDVDEAEAALSDIKNPRVDFYFFQSKTSTSFDYGEMSKFFDSVKSFFNGSLEGESDQLDDLIEAKNLIYRVGVKRQNPGVYLYYCTTGSYESQNRIERLVENTRNELLEMSIFDEERVQINIYGAGQLQRLYRAASTATEVTLNFRESVVLPKHDSVEEAYIGFIPAKELVKIISTHDDDGNIIDINKTIFFDNIRDYNPDSKINIEIIESLKSGGQDDFVYRNNGVTVVSRSIDRTGNNFTISDFQVVNGCQTSNVLFHNREIIDGVYVPFRLIGTNNEDFIVSIISGTNKQNPVKPEQFWSLLPFMKNLEEFARNTPPTHRVFLERRENQYRGESIERSRIVQMQPFLKAVTAGLLGSPHRAARNYKAEIKSSADEIFAEDQDVRPAYSIAFLHYRLEFLWRNQKIDASTKIFRFYFIDAISRRFIGNKSFVNLNKSQKAKFAEEILSLAIREEQLIRFVNSVSIKLQSKIDSLGITQTRERLRDAIRSETFFISARKDYVPSKPLI